MQRALGVKQVCRQRWLLHPDVVRRSACRTPWERADMVAHTHLVIEAWPWPRAAALHGPGPEQRQEHSRSAHRPPCRPRQALIPHHTRDYMLPPSRLACSPPALARRRGREYGGGHGGGAVLDLNALLRETGARGAMASTGATRSKAEQEKDKQVRGGGALGTSAPPTAGCSLAGPLTPGGRRLCVLQAFMAVYKTLSDEIVADEVADQQARRRAPSRLVPNRSGAALQPAAPAAHFPAARRETALLRCPW